MFKVANNMRGLLFVNRYYNTRNLYINGANPIRDRVMSTPSWPVPYYQRIVKAYPIRQESKPNLGSPDVPAGQVTWLFAKTVLNQSAKGRQTVSYTEQNINTKTYLIKKDDCETMARAYVNDISQFLDLTNKQNIKILKEKTLI